MNRKRLYIEFRMTHPEGGLRLSAPDAGLSFYTRDGGFPRLRQMAKRHVVRHAALQGRQIKHWTFVVEGPDRAVCVINCP